MSIPEKQQTNPGACCADLCDKMSAFSENVHNPDG